MIPKVSVIVAIYNAEKTLNKALDSIKCQTMTNFEVVMIDDGSTDSSGSICDEYVAIDSRFKVIHKQNEGVANARKIGVETASGEYSIHVDSDDWIEPNMFEVLYAKAKSENADMLICDFYHNYPNGRQVLIHQNPVRLNTPDQIDNIFTGDLFCGLTTKFIKHSIYKKYGISFYSGIDFCEDLLVCVQIMKHLDIKIIHIGQGFYHYYMNENSITHSITKKSCETYEKFLNVIYKLLNEDRYLYIRDKGKLSLFRMKFIANVYDESQLQKEFNNVKGIAYREKCLKWRFGYMLISIGCYKYARLLLDL